MELPSTFGGLVVIGVRSLQSGGVSLDNRAGRNRQSMACKPNDCKERQ